MTKHLPPSCTRDCHTAAAAGGTGQEEEGDGKKSPWSPRITRLPIIIIIIIRDVCVSHMLPSQVRNMAQADGK
jgi:hypothetical protein